MSKVKKVFLFTDKASVLPELCSGGISLAEEVIAVVAGSKANAEEAVKWGANLVLWLGEIAQGAMLEDYTPVIAELIKQEQPELVIVRASARGKLIAGRLAAGLGTNVLTDVMSVSVDGGSVIVEHRVFGGAAIRIEKCVSGTAIATVGSGVFEKAEAAEGNGTITELNAVKPQSAVKYLEKREKAGESVDLSAAKKIVGIGRGLATQEDLRIVEELAKAIGAEVGCSRPIAEGVNWMAKERYIGVSGVMTKPELYIALGISGQIQHMVGVNSAKTIVAVNKDKNAPIFQNTDYGIVGDIYKVMPALTQLIHNAK